jgi:hypothetical protein
MKYWLRWEMLDINAILETIMIKSNMELKRLKKISKNEANKRDLQKLNTGKNTVTSMFMSKDGKITKITNLTHTLTAVHNIYIT